ncbi:FkbM family methyltransferase [Methylobacterium sp. D54C]|jgi:FkbM family methyltransferase
MVKVEGVSNAAGPRRRSTSTRDDFQLLFSTVHRLQVKVDNVSIAKHLMRSAVAPLCARISRLPVSQKYIFNAVRLNRPEMRPFVIDNDIRFLNYCIARRDRSRSQILQDLWVCFELGEKSDGFFVEFGATNGLKNSNTWLLEKKLGWKGILAEPNPVWHRELMRNRDAFIETRCVSSRSGETVSFLATDDADPELSGMEAFSDADHFSETRKRGARLAVETISLDDLLDQYGAPEIIDYMSIDTEGSELEILSSYSFRHKFRTLSVENNPKTERAVEEMLVSKGYHRVFAQFSQWDSWYVSSELRSSAPIDIVAPEA